MASPGQPEAYRKTVLPNGIRVVTESLPWVRSVQDVLSEGDEVLVKVIEVDGSGKMRLSRKMALRDQPALADREKLKNPNAANPPRD